MKPVDFDLEEYRALRSEIIQSMDDGNQVMSFGLAAIGLALGAAITLKDADETFFLLVLCVPFLVALVMSYWFAAQERIARASHYLSGVETRIRSEVHSEASVSWEAWIRLLTSKGSSRDWWTAELSAILLFVSIILVSFIIGLATRGSSIDLRIRALTATFSAVVTSLLLLHLRGRYLKWKYWLRTTYDDTAWDAYSKSKRKRVVLDN